MEISISNCKYKSIVIQIIIIIILFFSAQGISDTEGEEKIS